MRTTRSSSVAPSIDEDAVSMTQVMDMMRTQQENVAASRFEQERMHEALVALTGSTKSCAKPFRSGRSVRLGTDLHPHPHRAVFLCHFPKRSWTRWSRLTLW